MKFLSTKLPSQRWVRLRFTGFVLLNPSWEIWLR